MPLKSRMASEADPADQLRPGQIWRFEAFSPEELEACFKPLDVRCRQLKAGRFDSKSEAVVLDTVLVGVVHHELSPKASGFMAPGALHFHNVRSAAPVTHGMLPLTANA